MSPWEGLNRRKFPRVKYPCLATVWYEGAEEEDTFLTHTENLGIGGVCIIFNKRLKLFTPIKLEIDLLDMEDHILSEGKVVWVVQCKNVDARKPVAYDIGIEFGQLKESDQQRVSRIVQRLGKHPENLV